MISILNQTLLFERKIKLFWKCCWNKSSKQSRRKCWQVARLHDGFLLKSTATILIIILDLASKHFKRRKFRIVDVSNSALSNPRIQIPIYPLQIRSKLKRYFFCSKSLLLYTKMCCGVKRNPFPRISFRNSFFISIFFARMSKIECFHVNMENRKKIKI